MSKPLWKKYQPSVGRHLARLIINIYQEFLKQIEPKKIKDFFFKRTGKKFIKLKNQKSSRYRAGQYIV